MSHQAPAENTDLFPASPDKLCLQSGNFTLTIIVEQLCGSSDFTQRIMAIFMTKPNPIISVQQCLCYVGDTKEV